MSDRTVTSEDIVYLYIYLCKSLRHVRLVRGFGEIRVHSLIYNHLYNDFDFLIRCRWVAPVRALAVNRATRGTARHRGRRRRARQRGNASIQAAAPLLFPRLSASVVAMAPAAAKQYNEHLLERIM